MKLEKRKTNRGFGIVEFKDTYGVDCSIQMSSNAEKECIWIGCDDANTQYFIPNGNPSWRKLELPQGATSMISNTRMHLTREQVKEIIPILQKFVKTGTL